MSKRPTSDPSGRKRSPRQDPTYLTVLALAYFRAGSLEKAVATQKQAVESPRFPPGYRDEALQQLHEFEVALAARKR
ncbi:hypothetical protein SBA3_1390020 [Candidatus Sulfopaludibacter sp. SbA3]|nr:hypothetical protein SBA3_1390020 [Candidatus Sulfopaludibacter sp. SbA3]